ncbi:MAG: hypothetical protein KA157_07955 [Aliarcobacter sp.]|jgi:DNA-binding transcriptional regulator GbsR (MarR family)|nr:hypothetical protein [Aliarcobacter sp.]
MKTVKELAIELGVSKSRILQVIKKLPITKQPKIIDRKYLLNDEDVINISNFVKGMRNKKNDVVSDGLSPSYRKLIDNLQEQNKTKDLQIEQLQKLLENQQILLLNEQKEKQVLLERTSLERKSLWKKFKFFKKEKKN